VGFFGDMIVAAIMPEFPSGLLRHPCPLSSSATPLPVLRVAGPHFSRPNPGGGEAVRWGAVLAKGGCLLTGLTAAGVAAITFYHSRRHRKDRADLRQVILEDMRMFAEKHVGAATSAPLAGAAPAQAAKPPANP
jgi:hypothetical protein